MSHWKKAPADATHLNRATKEWLKFVNNSLFIWNEDTKTWLWLFWLAEEDTRSLEPRPEIEDVPKTRIQSLLSKLPFWG